MSGANGIACEADMAARLTPMANMGAARNFMLFLSRCYVTNKSDFRIT
jgi:hypothetical protein